MRDATLKELVLNKRFGKHELPPGWHVISASNRLSDKSGVSVIRPPRRDATLKELRRKD
jgi:hypothetical protein